MPHYFFDLRDGDDLAVDEEGMELRDIQAAQEEAARALADMARDEVRRGASIAGRRDMAVEVRDAGGAVLEVKFTFAINRHKQ